MTRLSHLFIALLIVSVAAAQNRHDLTTFRGWEHSEAMGDLDRDGISDLVVIATPDDKAHILTNEETGSSRNLNRPVLAIFKGNSQNQFTPWKFYDEVMPVGDEYLFVEYSVSITDKGVLRISTSSWASAGGWGQTEHTYVFRFQNGDFYLIGEDEHCVMRNTGEDTTDSYNYLTHKHQRVVTNAFKDVKVKPKETWKSIPREPLKRLGEEEL